MDVIERNPDGFEAVAGERGRMFSEAASASVSIARALSRTRRS